MYALLNEKLETSQVQQERGDVDLVEQAVEGNQWAFESLYRSNVSRIHALCLRLVGGHVQLAEEMTQEAFIRAWNKLSTFQGRSSFSTWLHRLTVNVVLSDKRSQARRRQLEVVAEDYVLDKADGLSREPGKTMDLEQLVARLPTQARTILVLHDIEGYKHREIAEMMGIAEGSSKAHLHRARKQIIEWMTDS